MLRLIIETMVVRDQSLLSLFLLLLTFVYELLLWIIYYMICKSYFERTVSSLFVSPTVLYSSSRTIVVKYTLLYCANFHIYVSFYSSQCFAIYNWFFIVVLFVCAVNSNIWSACSSNSFVISNDVLTYAAQIA